MTKEPVTMEGLGTIVGDLAKNLGVIGTRVDSLTTKLDDLTNLVNRGFSGVNQRIDSLENKVDAMDAKFELKFEGLTETMLKCFDEVYGRLDKMEFGEITQEKRVSILEGEMKIVSSKLGLV